MAYIILLLYAILVFFTIKTKQTYTPAGAMVFLWTALNGILLLFFRDWVEIKYPGFFYIVIGVGVFLCGAIVEQKTAKSVAKNILLRCNRTLITPTLAILTILGFIWPLYYIYSYGFSLSNLFNLDELSEMNKEFSTERYYSNEEIKGYSYISQLLLIFTYTAPIFGGFCWFLVKRVPTKSLCILTVVPCILITASQSTKMTTISALILWFGGLFSCIHSYNIKVKLSIRTIIVALSVLILFLLAMFFSRLTRWDNNIDDYKIERNKITFFDYAFGSLLCFDYWFYDYMHNTDYSTTLLQNSKLRRLGYLRIIDDGVKVEFPNNIHAPSFEIYGAYLGECEYQAGKNYIVSFDVTSNVKPDSVRYSLVSYSNSAQPESPYSIRMHSCQQIDSNTWHYQQTFNLDSNRIKVRTPDIILSFDSVKYVSISHLRIDTGSVAMQWTPNGNNIFWRENRLWFGASTFYGICKHIGITEKNLRLYQDFVYFGRLDKTMRSNVYTLFRMLIEDFGKIGALVFLFLLGFISTKTITYIHHRKFLFLAQTLLCSIYCEILWSFATSFWAFTSLMGASVFSFFIFSILQKPLHGDTWVTKITKKLKPKQK